MYEKMLIIKSNVSAKCKKFQRILIGSRTFFVKGEKRQEKMSERNVRENVRV